MKSVLALTVAWSPAKPAGSELPYLWTTGAAPQAYKDLVAGFGRKGLKLLLEHAAKWPAVLEEPPGSPEYDFARKSALDAVESTKQTATALLKSQEEYFSKHKAEKEPKKKADD